MCSPDAREYLARTSQDGVYSPFAPCPSSVDWQACMLGQHGPANWQSILQCKACLTSEALPLLLAHCGPSVHELGGLARAAGGTGSFLALPICINMGDQQMVSQQSARRHAQGFLVNVPDSCSFKQMHANQLTLCIP